jgi:iron complex transport system substrate-binding protein
MMPTTVTIFVANLIRAGVAVHAFNQHDVAGILAMIRMLGALVGATSAGAALRAAPRRPGS